MKAFEGGAFSYFVTNWFDYCVSIKHIDDKKKKKSESFQRESHISLYCNRWFGVH